jgi:hypothetical protein
MQFQQYKVSRPVITDTIGYEVDVKSTEVDAGDDDVYFGIIKSFDIKKEYIHVIFEGADGADNDEEDLLYDSIDISWMKEPTNKNITIDTSIKISGKRLNLNTNNEKNIKINKNEPKISPKNNVIYKKWDNIESKKSILQPKIEDTIGKYIAISDEDGDIKGLIVGYTRKMLQIKLLDDNDSEDEEIMELQYNLSSLRWYQ